MCGSLVFVDFIGQLNHKCKGQNETVVNFKVCPYVYIFLSANLIDHKMSFIGKQQKVISHYGIDFFNCCKTS